MPDGTTKLVDITDGIPAEASSFSAGPGVFSDDEAFVSPIDGSVVRGRAQLREHCARHDVIPNRDLVGLRTHTVQHKSELDKNDRAQLKRDIIRTMEQYRV